MTQLAVSLLVDPVHVDSDSQSGRGICNSRHCESWSRFQKTTVTILVLSPGVPDQKPLMEFQLYFCSSMLNPASFDSSSLAYMGRTNGVKDNSVHMVFHGCWRNNSKPNQMCSGLGSDSSPNWSDYDIETD